MKSRLRPFYGLCYALLQCMQLNLHPVAGWGTHFLAAAQSMSWPGATPHFEGRSRPTLRCCCMLARSMTSCRFCRRLCEGPNEQSLELL